MRIEQLLTSSEKDVINVLKHKIESAKSVDEVKLHKHHVGIIIENAISREQLKLCNQTDKMQ